MAGIRPLMRWPVALALVMALGCAGPSLREPAKVKPKRARERCGLRVGEEVTREQAICIAGLAGLNTAAGAYELGERRRLDGTVAWVFEESCTDENPRCLGISIRRADGEIVETRYLYVVERHGPDFSS